MKKLMIAAAVAAMGVGAFADCYEAPVTPVVNPMYPVYQFKASLKTTKGVLVTTAAGEAGHCGEAGNPGGCWAYRTKDSMSLQGWLYTGTDCTCNGWVDDEVVVWDTKRKCQLTDAAFAWGTTAAAPHVMGKNKTEAEAFWTLTGTFNYNTAQIQTITLYGAGMGSFSKAKATFSLSGNCAGTMAASYDLKRGNTPECCEASEIFVCDNLVESTADDTVAYGSWSIKYNASATTKWNKKGLLTVPNYVTL